MKNKRVVISSQYLITDPPTHNIVQSFCELGWDVSFIQQASYPDNLDDRASFIEVKRIDIPGIRILTKVINWIYFNYRFQNIVKRTKPDLIITIMYYPISVINPRISKHLIGILDIPSLKYAGKFDKVIIRRALKRINVASFTWASDPFKAELIKDMVGGGITPCVCYNAPRLDYFQALTKETSRSWVQNYLLDKGVVLANDQVLLLRAGAIGEGGGLEETLNAFNNLPEDLVFVMMGRPGKKYAEKIKEQIVACQLQKRVILIERPDDIFWKKMLLAADIGHLIHTKVSDGQAAANYELNSSLSNNRLFQYMRAGMPIISYLDERMNKIHKEIDCFMVVDTNSLQSEIERVCLQLMNKELRIQKGTNAITASQQTYNWEKQFESIKTIVKQL